MKVLVLGGTGAMGIHLVKLLGDSGNIVTVTSRSKINSTKNVNYVCGNAHDDVFLAKLLKESWDVIVDFMVYSTSKFELRINTLLKRTKQYVYLSSARVYSNNDSIIKENTPRLLDVSNDNDFLATDEYSLSKAKQENILKDTGKLNWTIIRPYITYDEKRLQLGFLEKEAWLYRALKGRTIVFSSSIAESITTLTYGFDVARGIFAVLNKDNAFGNTFHITVDDSNKWENILQLYISVIERHIGYRPKYILLNDDETLKMHSNVYQIKYDRMFNRVFDNTKINRFIDTKDFKKTLDGLEICLQSFLINPKFNNVYWPAEAMKDKICREHTSFIEIKNIKSILQYIYYRYLKK
ncbi:NAD(P)H-binding protein [Polaribacter sp. BAL334]|uniref:NAD-dependent epimerase/dehydratase family protein n=1 Tax=Polaribacter sp. BAL334 TaxID=1708178 RepID=UPI0018D25E00|nr:NAD-dependent epimerase/dehydratase family protein [Polaribacter sp. BAL334]MBG7611719.1 NAD(P)H-binding protein [Polaribacter sp. BAL334]